jgi:hypothetical protein
MVKCVRAAITPRYDRFTSCHINGTLGQAGL